MNLWLVAAAGASALTMLIHLVAGGREAARPLLATDGLAKIPKFTLYYCWHLVTIAIVMMAAGFFYASGLGGGTDIAVAATAGAILFTIWNLLMIVVFKLRLLHFPQWILFATIAILGLCGLVL